MPAAATEAAAAEAEAAAAAATEAATAAPPRSRSNKSNSQCYETQPSHYEGFYFFTKKHNRTNNE